MSIFDKHPDEEREELYNLIGIAEQKNAKLTSACELVLLFHGGHTWSIEHRRQWDERINDLLETKLDGVTTKNLCDAVRVALGVHTP